MPSLEPPRMGEPYLLTPGPLTTSYAVKAAMLRDHGSWDSDFRAMTADIRARLVALLGDPAFDCVPLQGSGSFAVESNARPVSFRAAGWPWCWPMVPTGNARRRLCGSWGVPCGCWTRAISPPRAGQRSRPFWPMTPAITHVVAIHCETSSGILNPLPEIAQAVDGAGRRLLVDSMSAFGGVPFDTTEIPCDALVSSANKCIEGVPGFGFVLARREVLEAAKGNAHSLALDIHAQWAELERSGQWRYTPPTHTIRSLCRGAALARG